MPSGAGARLDHVHATLASLRGEQRRLERLGLETPLARCEAQIRYWRFVAGLLALSQLEDASRRPWPGAAQ